MKKIICLFALLFISLFANANTNDMNTLEFEIVTQNVTTCIKSAAEVISFVELPPLLICYTTTLKLLVDSYPSPTSGQTVNVYEIHTSTVCVPF